VRGSPPDLNTADSPAQGADQFECTLAWQGAEPLLPGRPYLLKMGAQTLGASVSQLKYEIDASAPTHVAARTLVAGHTGVCNISLERPLAWAAQGHDPDAGIFALIDRTTTRTVATGRLHFALRRAHNLRLQAYDIDKAARSALLGQRPAVVWLTGLSGAGKSALANGLAQRLHAMGRAAYVMDGDNVRHGLSRDLGFTDADRVENIRRVAEVARLMVDAGLIVITAFISPFRSERALARSLMAAGEFVEVHVDVPLAVAEARDAKGLYAKARRGELPHFTGIDSAYEAPVAPELRVDTARLSAQAATEQVLERLCELGILPRPA
jgi:bifunctional enzyme CysN/CysC